MAAERVGALRYELIADTEKFEKDLTASRKELTASRRAMTQNMTPAERYGQKIEELNNLRRKGLIDAKTYTRAVEREGKAHKKAAAEAGKAAKQYKTLGMDLKSAATGMLAFVSARAALATVGRQFTEVDEITKAARKLGLLGNELVSLRLAAAEFSGMAGNQVDTALQRMTRRISEAAAGSGEAQEAIKELGLSARDLNMAGPAEAFRQIADAIRDVESPQDRLRLAFKLFDSEGAALVNTLSAGREGLDAMAVSAEKLGLTFTQLEAAEIEKANDAITEMSAAWDGMARSMAITFAPAVKEGSDLMVGFLDKFRESQENYKAWVEWLTGQDSRGAEAETQRRAEAVRAAAKAAQEERDSEQRFREAQEHNIKRLAEIQAEKDAERMAKLEKDQQVYRDEQTKIANELNKQQAQLGKERVASARKDLSDFEKTVKTSFKIPGITSGGRGSRDDYDARRDRQRAEQESKLRAEEAARAEAQRQVLVTELEKQTTALEALEKKLEPVLGV